MPRESTIQVFRSATPSAIPSGLTQGEIAINLVDNALYYGGTAGQSINLLGTSFASRPSFSGGLTADSLWVTKGATFASNIFAPNIVNSVNGSTGAVSFAVPLASSSVTGVASFGNEFVVTLGAVGLTSNYVKSINGSTGAITIGAAPAWSVITADQTAVINSGYLTNKTGTVLTLTLPTTAAVGSVIRVSGMNATGWKIAQNASGIIHFGKTDTTTGTGGYIQSTLTRDAVELVCCVANNEWNVLSSVGNITIV